MRPTVFLAYSIGDSSVSAFFSKLALQLSLEFDVVIFSDRKNAFPFKSSAIQVLYWPSPRPTKLKDFVFLRKAIKQHKPQLMLATFGANNLFALAGKLSGVKHRIATHRSISSHFKSSAFKVLRKRFVFGWVTQIITNSKATKQDVMDTFGVSDAKIKVVYNAVPDPQLELERDPNKIAYVGRLSVNKGIDVLLDAFQIVVQKKPELRLELLGGSETDVAHYKTIALERKINNSIQFYGSQPKEKVLETFATASLAVVPSLSEGFGFVVIEAFSVRTPVIGSNTGGIKEIIRNELDGILVTPGDAQILSEEILALCEDAEKRTRLGSNAYDRFLTTFELNRAVEELALYLATQIKS